MLRSHIFLAALLAASTAAHAADPAPEIHRAAASPQAVGVVHTLRTIPEACTRLEGQFTGNAGKPYKFAGVRTSERCAPRAKLVDAATAKASVANGWLLNDVIRVTDTACPSRKAVVRVRRKVNKTKRQGLDKKVIRQIYFSKENKTIRRG